MTNEEAMTLKPGDEVWECRLSPNGVVQFRKAEVVKIANVGESSELSWMVFGWNCNGGVLLQVKFPQALQAAGWLSVLVADRVGRTAKEACEVLTARLQKRIAVIKTEAEARIAAVQVELDAVALVLKDAADGEAKRCPTEA